MHAAVPSTPNENAEVDMEAWISSTLPIYSVPNTECPSEGLACYKMPELLSPAERGCKRCMLRYTT